jgi:predicted DNA-binding transcriptional regulator YafY
MRLVPAGVLADRGLWYLVAYPAGSLQAAKHLRADRVRRCEIGERIALGRVAQWRDEGPRPWLREAMQAWVREAPVTLEISAAQWRRLARDWYFGTGLVQPAARGRVRFSWGESDFERMRELLAWLGRPARLIEPAAWIPRLQRTLVAHAAAQRPLAR